MRPAEFSDLQGLIQGLSTGIQGELDKRLSGERSRAARAGRVLRLAPRPPFLAGREELLAELDARLAGGDGCRAADRWRCAGWGARGRPAWRWSTRTGTWLRSGWPGSSPAEDPAVLAAGFGELAAQLGARDLADTRDPVASVHGVLAAFPAEWLLVFDNAPDRASVAAFVPPAGRGRVLITSQNPLWPPGQALEVPVLDPEVAAEFLVNRTGDPDRQAALELAGELGGLPLALEQAAAYIQATGDSLAGYLALFRQRRAGPAGPRRAHRVRQDGGHHLGAGVRPAGAVRAGRGGLLRLLAFCAPEAIPLRLLLQPRPGLAGAARRRGGAGAGAAAGGSRWPPRTRSRRCAGIRWSARPRTGRCRCTGWCRPSPPIRCPRSWPEQWRQAAAAVIEAAIPGDTEPAGDLAGLRGAAAARPGGPGR